MTYSVLARCPRTGRLGLGVASYSIAIGLYCDAAVRPNTGVTLTQGFPLPRNNRFALNLLAQGFHAGPALKALLDCDPEHGYRQIGVIDREGGCAAHTGTRLSAKLPGWAGHRIGDGAIALGCQLAGEKVVKALAGGFAAEPQAALEDRLLAALEAGRDAGGIQGASGRLPERSVALIVWGRRDYSDLDLRVDLHDTDAVAELRRVYVDYQPSAAYYEERARHPQNAIPAMEFAEMLKSKQGATP